MFSSWLGCGLRDAQQDGCNIETTPKSAENIAQSIRRFVNKVDFLDELKPLPCVTSAARLLVSPHFLANMVGLNIGNMILARGPDLQIG